MKKKSTVNGKGKVEEVWFCNLAIQIRFIPSFSSSENSPNNAVVASGKIIRIMIFKV